MGSRYSTPEADADPDPRLRRAHARLAGAALPAVADCERPDRSRRCSPTPRSPSSGRSWRSRGRSPRSRSTRSGWERSAARSRCAGSSTGSGPKRPGCKSHQRGRPPLDGRRHLPGAPVGRRRGLCGQHLHRDHGVAARLRRSVLRRTGRDSVGIAGGSSRAALDRGHGARTPHAGIGPGLPTALIQADR